MIVLCVRISKVVGKTNYYTYQNDDLSQGDIVIVETVRGIESGKVLSIRYDFNSDIVDIPKIIRKADKNDIENINKIKKDEIEAYELCRNKILYHKLNIKLIDAEIIFDRKKIIFYFTSDNRVDFRNLVKDLASKFKIRIELRQIGFREEARMLGGIGGCGRDLCCATFFNDFQNISLKMAKEQKVSLTPMKTTGVCGKLMCCLKYEDYSNDSVPNLISE